jgi:small subunit ribosomal protein S36
VPRNEHFSRPASRWCIDIRIPPTRVDAAPVLPDAVREAAPPEGGLPHTTVTPGADDQVSHSHWWRRVPSFVWAVTAAHTALLLLFTILYPPFISFDEPQHVDMVVSLMHGDGWPAPGTRIVSEGVVTSSQLVMGSPTYAVTPFAARSIAASGQRPSLAQLGGDRPASNHMINQIVQHPPLYYAIGAAVLEAVPNHDQLPYDQFVWILRLVSVVMIIPLPILAWAACRRITDNRTAASAAAVVPAAIPGLTRIGASVNNDNLITLLFAILAVLLLGVANGDQRRRTAAWVGVVTALAILTKAFGWIAVPTILVCYLIGWRRNGGRLPWTPAVIALAVSVVAGGWWWVRNVVEFGSVQPNGYGFDIDGVRVPSGVPRHDGHWAGFFFNLVARTFWSGLGVPLPPEIPRIATLLALYISIALVVVGIVVGTKRAGGRWVLLAACLPFVLTLLIMSYQSFGTYRTHLVVRGAQGRYLFLGVVWLAPAIAIGLCALLGRLQRLAPLLLLTAAGVLQFLAVESIIRLYWNRPGPKSWLTSVHQAVQSIDRWSPVPGELTVVFGLFCVLGCAAALGYGLAGLRSAAPAVPPPSSPEALTA